MNRIIPKSVGLAIGAATMLVLASTAAASTVTVTATFGGTWLPGSTVTTFDAGQPANLTLANGAAIVTGSQSGSYAAPWVGGPNGGPDQTPYVSVFQGSSATLTLTQPSNYLGLLWGSVDPDPSRNLISLYRGETLVGTVQGADIVAQVPGLVTAGGPGSGTNWDYLGTVYANISSSLAFDRVVFEDLSGGNSFEFDNVAVVPLPMALPLFASAMIGLGLLGKWRESRGEV